MCDMTHDCDGRTGQLGRCNRCGADRADQYPTERRTGGAGSLTHPLTDREYKRQMNKLSRRAGK